MEKYTKEELEKMNENLTNKEVNGWDTDININKIFNFAELYKEFLKNSKVERQAVKEIIKKLDENGFRNINDLEKLNIGDKVYFINNKKAVYALEIKEDILNNINLLGSHIDSPRLDLKVRPLYEELDLALFKTQYYGGIKKYQWTAIPLSLVGVITKRGGEIIEVNIGDKDSDPIFTITDILPHLGREQISKPGNKLIDGEQLNVLVGSQKIGDINGAVKLNILNILNKKYGIREQDLSASELSFVPNFKPRDLGFDCSMVAGYGQDDKVCAFASLYAFLSANSTKTKGIIFADKEEIGSYGNTGMQSELFDTFLGEVITKLGYTGINDLRTLYKNMNMLSADVDGSIEPNFKSPFDEKNNSKMGYGVVITKYTGSGGKYSASDANSEYVRKVMDVFDDNNIVYQVSSLGKVDAGGGGTIAYILANKGVNVVDCGISVMSMHAPLEVSSKFDIYEMYKAYTAFYENM